MSVHQWDPGSILWRAFFFLFFSLLFFLSPPLSPRLAFLFFPSFFCPPLISSSPSPLPSFLFSFYYSFPIRFLSFLLFVSPFLLLFFLSFLPLFYFPDFFLLFLSSLFLILFLFFSLLTQNDDFLWCSSVYRYDRSNWILTDQTGFWSTILADYVVSYPLHCNWELTRWCFRASVKCSRTCYEEIFVLSLV